MEKENLEKKMKEEELRELWKDMNEYEDELRKLYNYCGENWVREQAIESVEETLAVLQEQWEAEMERRGLSWNELADLAEQEL